MQKSYILPIVCFVKYYCNSVAFFQKHILRFVSCTGVEIDDTKNFEEVITVASLNADGVRSSYSSVGSTIWVSGFGGEYGINDDISNAASSWSMWLMMEGLVEL